MGYRLRMSAEVGEWLSDLCASEPATAAEVGAALLAAMNAAKVSGLALVSEPSSPRDPREAADLAYQRLLEQLQRRRREVADVATARHRLELTIDERVTQPDTDPAETAQLLRQLDDVSRRQAELSRLSQRMQQDIDAYRITKETAKAMYTAAEASLRISEAVAAASAADLPPGTAQAADESELAELNRAVADAETRLADAARQAEQTLRDEGWPEGGQAQATGQRGEPAEGVLELQADTLGVDIRILIAQEPADAVTVLAVLEGEAAISEQRDRALDLAAGELTGIRAGAGMELTFSAGVEFLQRFFPAAGSEEVSERAAALASAQTLAGLRRLAGKDAAEVAAKTSTGAERLRQFEEAGLGSALVGEAVPYVRALGGRLTLTARFGGDEPVSLA